MATLTGQTIASSYEQLLHVDRDGGGNSTTLVSIKDGDNGTTFGFQISTNALMMTSTNQLQFGDTGTYIYQSADGVLDLVSDTEIEINATDIDINGAVDISGALVVGGNLTVNGTATYINSTTLQVDDKLIELAHSPSGSEGNDSAIDGGGIILKSSDSDKSILWENDDDSWHFNQGIVIGSDGSGHDVTFHSGTSGDSFVWDSSAEKLTITGTNGQTALDIADGNLVVADNIDLEGDIDVNGTANLDNTDIDGTFTQDAGNVVFNEASGDYDFRIESNGNANMFFVDGGNDVIGIGTNSPDTGHLLTLKTSGTGGDWIKGEQSDGGQGWRIGADSGDDAFFELQKADASQTILLSADGDSHFSGGNVGIGTSSPSNVLHIEADSGDEGLTVHSAGDTANAVILDANRSGAGSALGNFVGKWNGTTVGYMGFFSGADTSNKDDATIRFATASAGSATEAMRITSAGNVGIGTNSPSTLMHLAKTGSTGDWAFTLDNNYSSSSDVQIQMGYANSSNRNSGISVAMDDTTSTEYLLNLASGGTERFRVTGDGKVGIGETSPDTMLHLTSATSLEPVIKLENTNANNLNAQIHLVKSTTDEADDDYLGQIDFRGMNSASEETVYGRLQAISTDVSDGTEDGRIYLASMKAGTLDPTLNVVSGNVGIGTSSPSFLLEASGSTDILNLIGTGTGGPQFRMTDTSDSSDGDNFGYIDFSAKNSANAQTIFNRITNVIVDDTDGTEDTRQTFATYKAGSLTETLSIVSGNVGIGTASPDSHLHIKESANGTNAVLHVEAAGGSGTENAIIRLTNPSDAWDIYCEDNTGSGDLRFYNGADRVTIEPAGNVGIGTASPTSTSQLHVESDKAEIRIKGTNDSASDEIAHLILEASTDRRAGITIEGDSNDIQAFIGRPYDTANTLVFETDATEAMRIDSSGDVKIGTTNYDNGKFEVYEDADDQLVFLVNVTNAFSNELLYLKQTLDTSESSFNFLMCVDHDQARMKVRGDGELYADGSSYNSGADYAEYFETKDGKAIDSGITVKLDGDKIVPCEDGDTPIGVIRPEGSSMTIGNTAWAKWEKKYLSDDYGKPIFEECTWTIWYENVDGEEEPKKHAYESDRIPSDVTKPDDAIVETHRNDGKKHFRRKLNPDYDSSKSYESRTERDEWQIVGLLGQIPVKKGQPIASNWIKMKDVSDTVEMYFVK